MSALAEVQRDFIRWLRTGDPEAAARLGGGFGPEVYLNTHRSSLLSALRESYALLRIWMGEANFDLAAAHHVGACDPVSWTLDAYGADFDQTLEALCPDAPAAAELARLEWALGQAFVAADAPCLAPAALAGVDWDRACVRLPPGARLLPIRTNADAILAALAAEAAPPDPAEADAPWPVLVWRRDLTPRFRRLGPDEARLGERLLSGVAFSDICGDLAEAHGAADAIGIAGRLLATWAAEGLISAGAHDGF